MFPKNKNGLALSGAGRLQSFRKLYLFNYTRNRSGS